MEKITVYGLLVASGSDLWISTQSKVPGLVTFPGHDRHTIIPVSGGLAYFDEDVVQSSKHELEGYLKFGMPMKGSFDIVEEDGTLKIRPVAKLLFFKGHLSDPVEWESSVEKAQIAAIGYASELLSAYTEQKMRAGISITIEDWQGPDRADKTTPDNIRMDVKLSPGSLLITASDGRKIDIELQDDVIRAFAYEPLGGKEEPVKVNMHKDGEIFVDTHDYECARGIISEMRP